MKYTSQEQIILLLIVILLNVISWYILNFSSVFISFASLPVLLNAINIIKFKEKNLLKICFTSIILSLWTAVFFGLFFNDTVFNSNTGDVLSMYLLKGFGLLSYILPFSPIFYLLWMILREKKSKIAHDKHHPKLDEMSIKDEITTSVSSENYVFPSLVLLEHHNRNEIICNTEEIKNKKELIRQMLEDFGILVTEIFTTCGSTITLFELVLARGYSANKIKSIDEDIARNLKVHAVRIISPFKNRGTVAIEVPNNTRQIVGLRSILETSAFQNMDYELPIVLGYTIDNQPYITDLIEMPHILVAGATGQGKSVALNSMIISLLYKKHPSDLKFILIDPKLVELSVYDGIKDFFKVSSENIKNFVTTDSSLEVANTLQCLCIEMKKRVALLKNAKCRNIKEYNNNLTSQSVKLPYIVVVIDEFADIDLKRNISIKDSIILLARQARAAGIHLIVATQRPSASAIDGDITANFPARIAFKVVKHVNSQIILGETGAEKLTGNGDMLFSYNSEIERIQGAFISSDEVIRVVQHVEEQIHS